MKEKYQKFVSKTKELLARNALGEYRQHATRDWLAILFLAVGCLCVLVIIAVYVFFFRYTSEPKEITGTNVSSMFDHETLEVLVERYKKETIEFESLRNYPLQAPSPGSLVETSVPTKEGTSSEEEMIEEAVVDSNMPAPTQ